MTTEEFIMAAANDQDLNKKLATLKTAEAIYTCAKEAGLTDTKDQFKASIKKLRREACSIDEDVLDDICGGRMEQNTFSAADKALIATLAGAVGVALATGWIAFV